MLAALTMASSASVVMSPTTISSRAAPTSAVSRGAMSCDDPSEIAVARLAGEAMIDSVSFPRKRDP